MGDGSVTRANVIKALKASGVDVAEDSAGTILAKGDRIETLILPPEVNKQMLNYLKRRYDVPIHWFFNPHMIPDPQKPSVH